MRSDYILCCWSKRWKSWWHEPTESKSEGVYVCVDPWSDFIVCFIGLLLLHFIIIHLFSIYGHLLRSSLWKDYKSTQMEGLSSTKHKDTWDKAKAVWHQSSEELAEAAVMWCWVKMRMRSRKTKHLTCILSLSRCLNFIATWWACWSVHHVHADVIYGKELSNAITKG